MSEDLDPRLRTILQADPDTPPALDAVLAPRRRHLRRGLVAAVAVFAVTAVGAGWWSEQNPLNGGQYALAEIPSTDWLLDAPDAGVVEPVPGASP